MTRRRRRPAFGAVECVLSLALIGLAAWGVTTTLLRRAEAPPLLNHVGGVWV